MTDIKPLSTTGIGSVPFLDPESTLDLIARNCPELPFWPQLVQRTPYEDMGLQFVDGLPLVKIDEENHRVTVGAEGREEALTAFYERFLSGDWESFAVPESSALGLYRFFDRAARDNSFGPDFLKVQVTGPVTFGQSIRTPDGKTLLDDPEFADVTPKLLGAKGAWLASRIRALGRTPIIFFDEPGLTGFGSAFSNLSREQVVQLLQETAQIAASDGPVLTGTHICGNTDWNMVIASGLDIINFDAYGFLDHFLLYPEEIKKFLTRGGRLAWGIVPTLDYTGQKAEELAGKLKAGLEKLAGQGFDLDMVRKQSLITPACGVGSRTEDTARAIIELLPQVRELLQA